MFVEQCFVVADMVVAVKVDDVGFSKPEIVMTACLSGIEREIHPMLEVP